MGSCHGRGFSHTQCSSWRSNDMRSFARRSFTFSMSTLARIVGTSTPADANILRHYSWRGLAAQHVRTYSSPTVPVSRITRKHQVLSPNQHGEQIRFDNGLRRSVNAHHLSGKRHKSNKHTESSQQPLSGLWKPTHLQRLYYGSESVKKYLLECLPSDTSKAFIVSRCPQKSYTIS